MSYNHSTICIGRLLHISVTALLFNVQGWWSIEAPSKGMYVHQSSLGLNPES